MAKAESGTTPRKSYGGERKKSLPKESEEKDKEPVEVNKCAEPSSSRHSVLSRYQIGSTAKSLNEPLSPPSPVEGKAFKKRPSVLERYQKGLPTTTSIIETLSPEPPQQSEPVDWHSPEKEKPVKKRPSVLSRYQNVLTTKSNTEPLSPEIEKAPAGWPSPEEDKRFTNRPSVLSRYQETSPESKKGSDSVEWPSPEEDDEGIPPPKLNPKSLSTRKSQQMPWQQVQLRKTPTREVLAAEPVEVVKESTPLKTNWKKFKEGREDSIAVSTSDAPQPGPDIVRKWSGVESSSPVPPDENKAPSSSKQQSPSFSNHRGKEAKAMLQSMEAPSGPFYREETDSLSVGWPSPEDSPKAQILDIDIQSEEQPVTVLTAAVQKGEQKLSPIAQMLEPQTSGSIGWPSPEKSRSPIHANRETQPNMEQQPMNKAIMQPLETPSDQLCGEETSDIVPRDSFSIGWPSSEDSPTFQVPDSEFKSELQQDTTHSPAATFEEETTMERSTKIVEPQASVSIGWPSPEKSLSPPHGDQANQLKIEQQPMDSETSAPAETEEQRDVPAALPAKNLRRSTRFRSKFQKAQSRKARSVHVPHVKDKDATLRRNLDDAATVIEDERASSIGSASSSQRSSLSVDELSSIAMRAMKAASAVKPPATITTTTSKKERGTLSDAFPGQSSSAAADDSSTVNSALTLDSKSASKNSHQSSVSNHGKKIACDSYSSVGNDASSVSSVSSKRKSERLAILSAARQRSRSRSPAPRKVVDYEKNAEQLERNPRLPPSHPVSAPKLQTMPRTNSVSPLPTRGKHEDIDDGSVASETSTGSRRSRREALSSKQRRLAYRKGRGGDDVSGPPKEISDVDGPADSRRPAEALRKRWQRKYTASSAKKAGRNSAVSPQTEDKGESFKSTEKQVSDSVEPEKTGSDASTQGETTIETFFSSNSKEETDQPPETSPPGEITTSSPEKGGVTKSPSGEPNVEMGPGLLQAPGVELAASPEESLPETSPPEQISSSSPEKERSTEGPSREPDIEMVPPPPPPPPSGHSLSNALPEDKVAPEMKTATLNLESSGSSPSSGSGLSQASEEGSAASGSGLAAAVSGDSSKETQESFATQSDWSDSPFPQLPTNNQAPKLLGEEDEHDNVFSDTLFQDNQFLFKPDNDENISPKNGASVEFFESGPFAAASSGEDKQSHQTKNAHHEIMAGPAFLSSAPIEKSAVDEIEPVIETSPYGGENFIFKSEDESDCVLSSASNSDLAISKTSGSGKMDETFPEPTFVSSSRSSLSKNTDQEATRSAASGHLHTNKSDESSPLSKSGESKSRASSKSDPAAAVDVAFQAEEESNISSLKTSDQSTENLHVSPVSDDGSSWKKNEQSTLLGQYLVEDSTLTGDGTKSTNTKEKVRWWQKRSSSKEKKDSIVEIATHSDEEDVFSGLEEDRGKEALLGDQSDSSDDVFKDFKQRSSDSRDVVSNVSPPASPPAASKQPNLSGDGQYEGTLEGAQVHTVNSDITSSLLGVEPTKEKAAPGVSKASIASAIEEELTAEMEEEETLASLKSASQKEEVYSKRVKRDSNAKDDLDAEDGLGKNKSIGKSVFMRFGFSFLDTFVGGLCQVPDPVVVEEEEDDDEQERNAGGIDDNVSISNSTAHSHSDSMPPISAEDVKETENAFLEDLTKVSETKSRNSWNDSAFSGSRISADSPSPSKTTKAKVEQQEIPTHKAKTSSDKLQILPAVKSPCHAPTTPLSLNQRRILEKFSSTLKKKGMEVLKLNRDKKWQARFLTVSKEVTWLNAEESSKRSGNRGQVPLGMLWLKRFSAGKEYSIDAIDNQGRGGQLFSQLKKVSASGRAAPEYPLSRKHLQKFKDSVLVNVECRSHEGRPKVLTFRCKTTEEAHFLCTGLRVVLDVLKRETEVTTGRTPLSTRSRTIRPGPVGSGDLHEI